MFVRVSVAVVIACVCVGMCPEEGDAPNAADTPEPLVTLGIGETKATFRRVSPADYKIDYPDFYLLEAEVTNRLYLEFIRATKRTKDDSDVVRETRKRSESGSFSTGDVPMRISDEATAWRDNKYPEGLDEHPVGLVTLIEAVAFCKWLTETHPDVGLFRLPTWNEWMIAAYGSERAYPWGQKWDRDLAHTNFGYAWDDRRTRTEPVRSRPKGRTPEGLYGMIGNVSEYLAPGDARDKDYFNLGARWMGGGFEDGLSFDDGENKLAPRTDYWGYSHHASMRTDDVGFRVLLDPSNDTELVRRDRIFKQQNNAWRKE